MVYGEVVPTVGARPCRSEKALKAVFPESLLPSSVLDPVDGNR